MHKVPSVSAQFVHNLCTNTGKFVHACQEGLQTVLLIFSLKFNSQPGMKTKTDASKTILLKFVTRSEWHCQFGQTFQC